jgi:hypothetical protein
MQTTEKELAQRGLDQLKELLGPDWEITPLTYGQAVPPNLPASQAEADLVVSISDPVRSHSGPILVEVKQDLSPKMITEWLRPRVELMRRITSDAAVLIISPWLSPRSREVLDSLGYGYLDLTGNVSFRINRPGVVLRTVGDQRSPQPAKSYARQLRGEKAGILVRVLVDVRPPHRASELAAVTGLSLAYVSRLLDTMEAEALITRQGRQIVAVDWPALLRARSAHYELLRANPPVVMVAPKGATQVLERMRELSAPILAGVAVTGPLAAAAVAPLTAGGGQVMVHVANHSDDDIHHLQRMLGLLPSVSTGGEVLLLRTASPSVFIGRRVMDGVPYVALSQLVLDSLGGTGRMPAEGEAVIEYMARHEDEWRLGDVARWSTPRH